MVVQGPDNAVSTDLRDKALETGFTLIEMLITVAVISLLTSIALPTYRNYVIRSQLTPAYSQLSSFATDLQQYYQDNRTYVGYTSCVSGAIGNFKYDCTLTASTYLLTATGSGSSVNGFVFTLDQLNQQKTPNVGDASWHTSTNCWVRTPAGDCK